MDPERALPGLRVRLGKNFYIFTVCLLIAVLFWVLNALNKRYQTVLRFPLSYEHLPEDNIVIGKVQRDIGIEVEAYGFDLFSYRYFFHLDSLQVDYRDGRVRQKGSRDHWSFPVSSFVEDGNIYLPSGIQLLKFLSDSIWLESEARISKQLPVLPQVDYTLEKQYLLNGEIITDPATVEVEGPYSLFDTLEYIRTVPLVFEKLRESVEQEVSLMIPPYAALSAGKVKLRVPVDQYTEGEVIVPIRLPDVADSLKVKLFPDKAKVRYLVALSLYDNVSEDLFTLSAEPEEGGELVGNTLRVQVLKKPYFVQLIGHSPERVEYIIRKK